MTPQEVTETALAAAAGTELVVVVDELSSAYLRWTGDEVTSAADTDDRQLTVIALGGGTPGVAAARGALDPAGIRALIAAARRARRPGSAATPPPVTAVDPDWGRPPVPPAAVPARPRSHDHFLFGYAQQCARTTYVASSAGLRRRYGESTALLDQTLRSAGGAVTWTGWCGTDLAEAGYRPPGDRLDAARTRIALPPAAYEVLLSPSCVADLMLRLYAAADARDAAEGRTVFALPGGGTRLGERLSPAELTLYSDPAEPGLSCAPFVVARGTGTSSVYDNGLPLTRTNWITDGVLTALVRDRGTAGATGEPATPEIGNLVLTGPAGGSSLAEMVGRTRYALLVTALWYVRDVDRRTLRLTGLTRDGVYLVEDGRIRCAVNDFRFTASPVDVLGQVREVGRTEPALPREYGEHAIRTAMPALRVADFVLSAVGDAR